MTHVTYPAPGTDFVEWSDDQLFAASRDAGNLELASGASNTLRNRRLAAREARRDSLDRGRCPVCKADISR